MVTVWWSAASLNRSAFWIMVKPLHLRSMLSKLMRCTENGNACSQQWSTERAQVFSMKMPNHTTNTSIAERTGLPSFASSAIFTWPLANWLPLLQASWQLFAGKLLPQLAECEKCFPRVGQILKYGVLRYRNKQTYIFLRVIYPFIVNRSQNNICKLQVLFQFDVKGGNKHIFH